MWSLKMDYCIKPCSVLQDWASLKLTFSTLKQTGSLQPNCRVNMHLLGSGSNWISKDHFSLPLQLRISFRFHFLYRFAVIYDFQTLISQTRPWLMSADPYAAGGAQGEQFLSAPCADGLAECSTDQRQHGGAGELPRNVSCAPSTTASIQRRLEEQKNVGRRRVGQRLSTSVWSCLIEDWRIYLVYSCLGKSHKGGYTTTSDV